MTKAAFRATHSLTLTNRHRRGSNADSYPAPVAIRVMLMENGDAWTEEEWRTATPRRAPDWMCRGGQWSYLGIPTSANLPPGYTTLRVKRLGMGPTVTRSPTEPTAAKLTVGGTASEIAAIREAARLDGKRPGPWVRDQVLPVARRRIQEGQRKR